MSFIQLVFFHYIYSMPPNWMRSQMQAISLLYSSSMRGDENFQRLCICSSYTEAAQRRIEISSRTANSWIECMKRAFLFCYIIFSRSEYVKNFLAIYHISWDDELVNFMKILVEISKRNHFSHTSLKLKLETFPSKIDEEWIFTNIYHPFNIK